MTGREITDAVMELAEVLGWRAVHFRPARTKHGWTTAMQGKWSKGWPDIILLRKRIVALEIKGDGDTLRPEQEAWLEAFRTAGCDALVVTSKVWMSGDVETLLR